MRTLFAYSWLCLAMMVSSFLSAQTKPDKTKLEIIATGNFCSDKTDDSSFFDFVDSMAEITDTDKSVALLLGNILPEKAIEDDHALFDQLKPEFESAINTLNSKVDRSYLVPGHHEWFDGKEYNVHGAKQTNKFFKSLSVKKFDLRPAKGCGEPKLVKINDDLIIVLIDSQWLMQDEDNEHRKKSSCEIDNNFEWIASMKEIIGKNKNKHIIIASHHPMYSYGNLGGNYKLKHHLIPLPILGSLFTSIRKLAVSDQKIYHPAYEKYRAALQAVLNNCEDCVVLSSHENNLQYREVNNNHFFTTGNGNDIDYLVKAEGDDFASETRGFVRISLLEDKTLQISLISKEAQQNEKVLFTRNIPSRIKSIPEAEKYQQSDLDTIIAKASDFYGKQKFLRGKFYRKAWDTELEFPVIYIDKLHGGLKPVQQGGGFQTKSIRLENEKGQQWVLRSINKDVEKVVPPALRGSFAQNLVQDGIAASHPYGAFVIPDLADAAGVMHANPKAVYLPYQDALGDYNSFGNKVYLFEERTGGNTAHVESFHNTKKTISTDDLVEKTIKNHKHRVDQEAVLRARLFDIWLGDWDRHDDQWRWAVFEEDGLNVYRPIPRDRDQVFFKNDGVLDYLASRPYFNPGLRKFAHKIDYLPGLVFNARHFDRSFLNQLNKDSYIKTAKDLQTKLTDDIIEGAFDAWPEAIQKLDKKEIVAKLKSRRKDLVKYAEEYYKLIAREVDVHGTDDRDIFILEPKEGKLLLSVYHKKEEEKHRIYQRYLDTENSKELRLFGLAKDDIFRISNASDDKIKLRIIGGSGDDVIENESRLKLLAYDRPDGMELKGNKVQDKRKDISGINSYNRKDFKQNRFWQFPLPGFYTDEGIGIKYNIWWKKFDFRSKPYRSDNRLSAGYYFRNSAFTLDYTSLRPDVFGDWDLALSMNYNGPSFIQFFYGFGNEYVDFETLYPQFENADNQTFHIVKGSRVNVSAAFTHPIKKTSLFTLQPGLEFIDINNEDNQQNRYYLQQESGISPASFDSKLYGSILTAFRSSRLDNMLLPKRGYMIEVSALTRANLDDTEFFNSNLSASLSTYIPFNTSKSIVLATYAGYEALIGDAEFFHFNYLSNRQRLRGFRTSRFAGERLAFLSTDLRLDIARSSADLPAVFGLLASFDTGRAWFDGIEEDSDEWHISYGGGFYFAPFEQIGFKFAYYTSGEEFQLSIGGSLAF